MMEAVRYLIVVHDLRSETALFYVSFVPKVFVSEDIARYPSRTVETGFRGRMV
jgi:hypothetical protein